jgi:hypothetical protein
MKAAIALRPACHMCSRQKHFSLGAASELRESCCVVSLIRVRPPMLGLPPPAAFCAELPGRCLEHVLHLVRLVMPLLRTLLPDAVQRWPQCEGLLHPSCNRHCELTKRAGKPTRLSCCKFYMADIT